MVQKRINLTPRSLIRLLPSQRRDVKEKVSIQETLCTPSISRIGVINIAILRIEDTESRLLSGETISIAFVDNRLLILIIVLDGSDRLVNCDVEIIVEILFEGRIPWDVIVPTHALLEGQDLVDGCARDQGVGCIARVEMAEIRCVVCYERAG